MVRSILLTLALFAGTVTISSAQSYPIPWPWQVPNGNQQGYNAAIRGTVTSFGGFNLQLQTRNGYNQYVHLHQGTVINPTGTTLQPGMNVLVRGYRYGNGSFEANQIDVANGYGNGACNNGRYGNGNQDGDRDDRGNGRGHHYGRNRNNGCYGGGYRSRRGDDDDGGDNGPSRF